MKNSFEHLPYRPCVGITLFNNAGHVFVGERIDTPGAWQMPQGGIERSENVENAALRELKEEIGTKNAKVIKIHEETICYDLPIELCQKHWNGQYRGQEQYWVAMQFTGKDSDINLNADDKPEFSTWQWVPLGQTLNLIVPFKKEVYQKVIAAFKDLPDSMPDQNHL